MPIGYDLGTNAGSGATWDRVPDLDALDETWRDLTDWGREVIEDVLEPVYRWVERVVDVARWVLETVAQVYPVRFYQWLTMSDERVCPVCGPNHLMSWSEDEARPAPPLHNNCRCQVVHAWTEYRTRYVEEWRLRWFTESAFDYVLTGWE